MTTGTQTCARYVVNFYKRYPGFLYDYDVELVEGEIVTEEVHTSHSFEVTEFRSRDGRAWGIHSVYETRETAVGVGEVAMERSASELREKTTLLSAGRERRRTGGIAP